MIEQRQPEAVQRGDNTGDEIDLRELWFTLLKYRRMILLVTLGAAIVATGFSLVMRDIYRAEVLIVPVSDDSKSAGLSSALGGLGGLASMAGISPGGGGNSEENLAVLKSRDFLWRFVQEKKLMPILFADKWDEQQKKWEEDNPKKQPGQMDVYRLFNEKGVLSVDKDKKTNLVTVAVEWTDAALAAEWANALVERLNQYLALQAIAHSEKNLKYLNEELARTPVDEVRKTMFDLIANEQKQMMLASTQKNFAFKVLDPAVEPDKKIKPKRLLIIILTCIAACFLSMIAAFFKEGIPKRREKSGGQATL